VKGTAAAIIVNYNGAGVIERCLRSLLSQSRPFDEIVVVENASADGSGDLVRTMFPTVRLIEPGKNLGFAAACNLGVKSTGAELVAILNNDLVLQDDWLEKLLEKVAPPWSFWASKIVFDSHPDLIDSAGDGMAVVGAGFKNGHGLPAEDFNQEREVFGPCGAAALYRRTLFEETGGFDEDFFLVYEDADLSMRAHLLNHRCLYVPQAVVRHCVNRAIGKFSDTYVYFGHRNSEFLFWKNMPTSLLIRYLPERIAFDLLSLAFFTLKGRMRPFLRAKWDFLRNLGPLRSKRAKVQAGKRATTEQIRALLDRNWLRYRRKPVLG